jgi:hypothetical protein
LHPNWKRCVAPTFGCGGAADVRITRVVNVREAIPVDYVLGRDAGNYSNARDRSKAVQ